MRVLIEQRREKNSKKQKRIFVVDRKVANLFLQTQVDPLQLLAELAAQSRLLPFDQGLPTDQTWHQ